ncbi:IS5 family transposase [Spiroplasma endosymbiont of Colias croceus]|uniref:IS5 family transposase n=1 Tax=Spiroplasma endosymbiont of Colias croceus TaxID=3066310 RepID=UPI0030D050C0
MMFDKLKTINNPELLRLTGINDIIFNKILEILKTEEVKKFKNGGTPNKLSLENRLLMTLEYWREYRTYFHITKSYGISESSCYRNIKWIENTLIKHPDFQQLDGQKSLLNNNFKDKTVIIDVTESTIQRPKKGQKQYYSRKKKKHTIKTQVIIEKDSKKIISSYFSYGKNHDFKILKNSKTKFLSETTILVDLGYQGIQNIHKNVLLPKRKSKKNPLTKEEKKNNKAISKMRVVIEHVFAILKKFKIISEKYRNRRKKFALRFNLIASIYNLQLLI